LFSAPSFAQTIKSSTLKKAKAIYVGETATVTVSPEVTTTYVCNVTNAEGCESTLEVTVFIDDGTGIPGVTLKRSFALYPNPSNGSVHLQFQLNEAKDIQVQVVNVIGDIMWMNQYNEVTDQLISFDLDRVAKGIYFVILKAEGETVSKKLVIQSRIYILFRIPLWSLIREGFFYV